MSIAQSAIAALHAATFAVQGELVTYTRSDTGAVLRKLEAVLARSPREVQNTDGAIVQVIGHDFLVMAADLAIAGVPFTPAKGDRIERQVNGTSEVYELMTPPSSPSDHHSQRLRLHSVRIQ